MGAEYKTKAIILDHSTGVKIKCIFQCKSDLSKIYSLNEHTSEGVLFIFNVLRQKIVWFSEGKTEPNTVTAVNKQKTLFFAFAILQTNNGTFCAIAVWN